ncbi:MAG TPA: hypothetical protein VF735_09005 [Pyrinomonadaceae bacterium]
MAAEARYIHPVHADESDRELELAEEALGELAARRALLALETLAVNERIREIESGVKALRRKQRRRELKAPLREVRFFGIEEAD